MDPKTEADEAAAKEEERTKASSHTFYVHNSERKLKLVAKTERQMDQFIASIERTAAKSIWAGKNRYAVFSMTYFTRI